MYRIVTTPSPLFTHKMIVRSVLALLFVGVATATDCIHADRNCDSLLTAADTRSTLDALLLSSECDLFTIGRTLTDSCREE